MNKLYLSILVLILFSSCNTLKLVKVLNSGNVQQKEFKQEIPFETRLGLVVIPVQIDGKTYHFLIDTGAPNVLSKELQTELNCKKKATQSTGDSQGKSEDLDFVEIPSISIGGITFEKTGAAVADLKKSPAIACLNIDGFIGSNLMKEAIWEFDYERKIITISNERSSFNIPENATKIPFKVALTSTPLVDITYNGVVDKYVTFDTGSNGYFCSSVAIYNQLKTKDSTLSNAVSYGSGSSGLYGVGATDTTFTARIDSSNIGPLKISPQAVSFEKGARTVGTKFFLNYRIILDWKEHEVVFIPVKNYDHKSFDNFGLSPMFVDQKLLVNELTFGSDAHNQGIELGDQIISINGKDVSNCTPDMWCEILENGFVPEEEKEVTLTLLKKGQIQTYKLLERNLLH